MSIGSSTADRRPLKTVAAGLAQQLQRCGVTDAAATVRRAAASNS